MPSNSYFPKDLFFVNLICSFLNEAIIDFQEVVKRAKIAREVPCTLHPASFNGRIFLDHRKLKLVQPILLQVASPALQTSVCFKFCAIISYDRITTALRTCDCARTPKLCQLQLYIYTTVSLPKLTQGHSLISSSL